MLRHLIPPSKKHVSYRGRYRVGGDSRIREVTLHTTVKEVAEKRLREIHEDAEREGEGLIPAAFTRKAMKRPLMELFEEFLEDTRKKGRTEDYVRILKLRFGIMAKECRWFTMKDVTARSFTDWRNAQKKYEPRTLRNFYETARVFCNWVDRRHEIENPLKRVESLHVPVKHPEGPRAFSEDELARLFAVKTKWQLLYHFLTYTGLRISEARRLRWGDLHLNDEKPGIFLRPESTKAKRGDWLPILSELLPLLKAHSCKLDKPDTLVFRHGLAKMSTLHRDMERAGIKLVDEYGRSAGFHTFRRTFITLLQRRGVHPRIIMQLARHKSLRLTDWTYTDSTKLPLTEGLETLAGVVKAAQKPTLNPQPAPLKVGQNGVSESRLVQPQKPESKKAISQNADSEADWKLLDEIVQDSPELEMVARVGVEPTHL